MRVGIMAVAFLCLSSAVGTAADDTAGDATASDVQCLVAAMGTASSNNAAAKSAGLIATMYFMGRIDARSPDLDLETALINDIHSMKPADIQAAALRCGGLLSARGKALQDIGQDLIRKGRGEEDAKKEKPA